MISKFKAHLLIHGFTILHAGTAGVLAQVPLADTAALTTLTVSMVTLIVKSCGANWTTATIESFAAQQLAQYVGITVAREGIKYFPGPGNVFSAVTTATITEAVGWATYEACKVQSARN